MAFSFTSRRQVAAPDAESRAKKNHDAPFQGAILTAQPQDRPGKIPGVMLTYAQGGFECARCLMIYLEVRDEGRHNIIKKLVIISTTSKGHAKKIFVGI